LFKRFEASTAAYVSYQSVVIMLDQVLPSVVCGQISHSLLFEQLVFGLLIA